MFCREDWRMVQPRGQGTARGRVSVPGVRLFDGFDEAEANVFIGVCFLYFEARVTLEE
jgi:hypothetical protein